MLLMMMLMMQSPRWAMLFPTVSDNMRQTVCHQQVLGFSPIFNHWPARHCYFRPLCGKEDEDYRLQYCKEAVACIIERHSQPQQSSNSPPPSPSTSSSSSSSSDSETGEPQVQRLRRGVRRTQKLVDNSQTAKEVAAARPKPKRQRPGKKALQAAAEMSQLLDGYIPPPSSAVLLDK
jgi:hypothetical protein